MTQELETDYKNAISRLVDIGNENFQLVDILRTILEGFDKGIFVRSIQEDDDPAWLIRLLPYIKALADAKSACAKAEGGDK